jgi:hypothetical protein
MKRKTSLRKKFLALAVQETETNKRIKQNNELVLAAQKEKLNDNDNRSQ